MSVFTISLIRLSWKETYVGEIYENSTELHRELDLWVNLQAISRVQGVLFIIPVTFMRVSETQTVCARMSLEVLLVFGCSKEFNVHGFLYSQRVQEWNTCRYSGLTCTFSGCFSIPFLLLIEGAYRDPQREPNREE